MPTAKIGASVDGGGTLDKAAPAATDLIQGNPDVNVIFGINNDSSLGTVQALKAAGKYDADWGVLASVDGSAPVMRELGDPSTPYKAEGGYPPYDFAVAAFNLLGAAHRGQNGRENAGRARLPADQAGRRRDQRVARRPVPRQLTDPGLTIR